MRINCNKPNLLLGMVNFGRTQCPMPLSDPNDVIGHSVRNVIMKSEITRHTKKKSFALDIMELHGSEQPAGKLHTNNNKQGMLRACVEESENYRFAKVCVRTQCVNGDMRIWPLFPYSRKIECNNFVVVKSRIGKEFRWLIVLLRPNEISQSIEANNFAIKMRSILPKIVFHELELIFLLLRIWFLIRLKLFFHTLVWMCICSSTCWIQYQK